MKFRSFGLYSMHWVCEFVIRKKPHKQKKGGKSEEETNIEIETTSETNETKQEQEGSTKEDTSPSLCLCKN